LGIGEVGRGGAGRFVSATLRPVITVQKGADLDLAHVLHDRIHEVCFIARSVNFLVSYTPEFRVAD
jgi:organic hydroperoxide reductase OsmC/OhrA